MPRTILMMGSAVLLPLLTACALGPVNEVPTSESEQELSIGEALAQYSAGWAARDTDAIVARHTENSEFVLVTQGAMPAKGKTELRATFDAIFEANPNYKSSVRSVRLGDDFAVVEYDVHMDPDRPAQAGESIFTPAGKAYSAPAVDIIVFENGLVTRKVTYLDWETVRANSASIKRVQQ